MGYQTMFTLNVETDNGPGFKEVVENALIEMAGDDDLFRIMCKWSGQEDDCIEVSRELPLDSVFTITGHGEGDGDIWTQAFKNGCVEWEWKLENEISAVPEVPPDIFRPSPTKLSEVLRKCRYIATEFERLAIDNKLEFFSETMQANISKVISDIDRIQFTFNPEVKSKPEVEAVRPRPRLALRR